MKKLVFDYGHGGRDGGAILSSRKESNDVLSIGREIATDVRRHGVEVDETRTMDATVSLKARSSFENRKDYDYFISFHRNAFNKSAHGVETFTYPRSSAKAKELANKVQSSLVGVGFTNRKTKEANFHVLRETKSAAILIEMGFIDNTADNKIFDNKRSEIIEGITKAILSQLGIAYMDKVVAIKPSVKSTTGTMYRVVTGSFADRANAEQRIVDLKKAGFESFIAIK